MHCAFQRRHETFIWTNESIVRQHVSEVLDLNMSAEIIDASKKFIALYGPGFFVPSAKVAVEGTP